MKTVLVVDDEYDLLESICAALEIEGYRLVSAANGRAALEVLQATRPDLVITDVMMPYVSGYELLDRMYRMPGFEAVPSLLMSAIDPRSHPQGPWKMVLAKPFSIDRLYAAVNGLIGPAQ